MQSPLLNQIQIAAQKERKRRVEQAQRVWQFRGNNQVIQTYLDGPRPREFMLEGPAETGKTVATLNLVHNLARKYANARGVIVRKTHVDMESTVLDVFKREFLNFAPDVHPYGGEDARFYEYNNGAKIWVVGIDRAGRVLSGGFDFIYVNQAEELSADEWEYLYSRTTGRAGVLVPGLLFGDMNPAPLSHWSYIREMAGHLLFLPTSHKDNPRLWNGTDWTEQGQSTLKDLSRLTGIRRTRLFEGKRANAEGLVYGEVWDEQNGSVTEEAEYVPDSGTVVWACDDGYSAGSLTQSAGLVRETGFYGQDTHPRVILLCQMKSDGHVDVFAESYACLKLYDPQILEAAYLPLDEGAVVKLCAQYNVLTTLPPLQRLFTLQTKLRQAGKENPLYAWPDFATHGPGAGAFRGHLYSNSINPYQVHEKVENSLQEMRTWLAADDNGWRRLRVHPRCKQLRMEMLSYALDPASGKPLKFYDHGPDALRYMTWALRMMNRHAE